MNWILRKKIKQNKFLYDQFLVRKANPKDAKKIVSLVQSLSLNENGKQSLFTEEILLRDGFGERCAFQILVAETNGNVVGYALYYFSYDTIRAKRGIILSDLFVEEAWRRQGIGRCLMKAAAKACNNTGGTWMFWAVLKRNRRARKFYKTIAPELPNVLLCVSTGKNFQELARFS